MRNKIRLLTCFVLNYEMNTKNTRLSPESIIHTIVSHYAKQAFDTVWFLKVSSSFKKSMLKGMTSEEWLRRQYIRFGVYPASAPFQKSQVALSHCLSFTYEFLNDKPDNFFCDMTIRIDARIEAFLKLHGAEKMAEEDLKPGDLVAYKDQKGWGHMAVFVERVNGIPYVISKHGLEFGTYIHPINAVGEHYGMPEFFSSKIALSQSAKKKLSVVINELKSQITPFIQEDKKKESKQEMDQPSEEGRVMLYDVNKSKSSFAAYSPQSNLFQPRSILVEAVTSEPVKNIFDSPGI